MHIKMQRGEAARGANICVLIRGSVIAPSQAIYHGPCARNAFYARALVCVCVCAKVEDNVHFLFCEVRQRSLCACMPGLWPRQRTEVWAFLACTGIGVLKFLHIRGCRVIYALKVLGKRFDL